MRTCRSICPADGDLPGETDTLGIARRHRCSWRGPAERHVYRERRVPRDPRRACQPAGGRADRALAVAHRRDQAWSRCGPAGGLPRQRALHRRAAGRRRRDRGRSIMSTAIRSSCRVPRNQVRSSPRVSDGRVTVEARAIQMTLGTRKLTADTKVRSSMMPEQKPAAAIAPVAPLGGRGKPAPAGRASTTAAVGETAANRSRQCGWNACSRSLEAGSAGDRHVQPADLRWRRRSRGLQRQRAPVAGRHDRLVATPSSSTTRPATSRRRARVHTEMMLDDVDAAGTRKATRTIGEGGCVRVRRRQAAGDLHRQGAHGRRRRRSDWREDRALHEAGYQRARARRRLRRQWQRDRQGKRTHRDRGPTHLHGRRPKRT